MGALIPGKPDSLAPIKSLVIDSVSSPHSRRAYGRALDDFLAWFAAEARGPFSKAAVQAYRAFLELQGLAPSTVNVRMAAIRKLASEAADNGLLAPELASGILRVKGVRRHGVRLGKWLTREQAEQLLRLPDGSRPKGLRDRALLAMLIGCGLRRAEAAGLNMADLQQRDGRWVIADLAGKHGRIRTVPVPSWAKTAVDEWTDAAGIRGGRIFRAVGKNGRLSRDSMTPQSVFQTVAAYGARMGLDIAPHDLRRTFARLAHRGRAALEQIQLSLGHASILTTERYLGVRQDLADAPCDHLGLEIRRE